MSYWEGETKIYIFIHLYSESLLFSHRTQQSHVLLKVCGVHRQSSAWTVFLFICHFQRRASVPLINLPWKNKQNKKKQTWFQPGNQVQRDIRAIDASSLCQECHSRPRWCGRRREPQYDFCTLSCAALQRTKGKFRNSTSAAINSSHAVSHNTDSWLQLFQDG